MCRIERGTRWWRSHAVTLDSFADMDSWSWKIIEFPKIWPLTCHNWVKYWPRTKNNTTNREYSARAICWSFPLSSTTIRLETPKGGRTNPLPLSDRRWRNTVSGRGLNVLKKRVASLKKNIGSKLIRAYRNIPHPCSSSIDSPLASNEDGAQKMSHFWRHPHGNDPAIRTIRGETTVLSSARVANGWCQ